MSDTIPIDVDSAAWTLRPAKAVRFHIEALVGSATKSPPAVATWAYVGGYDAAGDASACARGLAISDAPGRYRVRDTVSGSVKEYKSDGEFIYYGEVRP
jgi:hypothetical protein